MPNESNDLNWEQSSATHEETTRLKRDICYLYHEQAEYRGIMGDLDYRIYDFPYWLYLDRRLLPHHDYSFIRDGCLVFILAMCWDQIDGSGSCINDKIDICRHYVSQLAPDDEDNDRLIDIVKSALDAAESGFFGMSLEDRLEALKPYWAESNWVHYQYIQGYFHETAKQFDSPL